MRHALTTTPTALAGVETGTRYFIQNQSHHVVHFITATGVPTNLDDSLKLSVNGATSGGRFRCESGESCYVWISNTLLGHGAVVYDEDA